MVSRLSAFLSSSSHNPVTSCLIFKTYVSKFTLRLLITTKHTSFICRVSKSNKAYAKLYAFFGTLDVSYKAWLGTNINCQNQSETLESTLRNNLFFI